MSMFNEIEKMMESANTSIFYRVILLGGKTLYLEGIKSVVSFGETEMQFDLKKCALSIKGNGLKLKYLDKTSCVIVGEIKAVETLWNLNLLAMI